MKLRYGMWIASCVLVVLGFSCDSKQKNEDVKKPTLYIVDVNSPEQYADIHIKGAVRADLDKIEEVVKNWDKSVPVVVYCSNYMCTASSSVAQQLKSLGFADVRAYEGGIAEWYQLAQNDAGYMYEGPAQQAYLKVVIEKPAHRRENITIIDATDLQKMMKDANIL